MKRIVIAVAATALVVAAATLALRGNADRKDGDPQRSGSSAPLEEGKGKSGRDGGAKRVTLSSDVASKRLLALREAPLKDAPSFEEVDALARHLDEAALLKLVGESGFADAAGLKGWVRSALFAEWGRRDPQAAMAWLTANATTEGADQNGVSQAWFALFRGWGETDSAAAIEGFAKHAGENLKGGDKIWRLLGSDWTSHAEVELFRLHARRDLELAWESAQARRDDMLTYRDAMSGFFRGLQTRQEVDEYLARWEPIWNGPEAVERQDNYRKAVTSRSSGLITRPPEEAVAREAAMALGKFDLSEAWKWLSTSGPRPESARGDRWLDFVPEWGRRNPEEAVKRLEDSEFEKWQKPLATGILDQDPSYAVEVMGLIDDHRRRGEALWESISVNASGHVRDMFPVPGQANRLQDFESSYQAILDAVEAGNFEPKRKESLFKSIYEDFRHNVPAAAAAHEARRGK